MKLSTLTDLLMVSPLIVSVTGCATVAPTDDFLDGPTVELDMQTGVEVTEAVYQPSSEDTELERITKVCSFWAENARTIMAERQDGMPAGETMLSVLDYAQEEGGEALLAALVKRAYRVPQFGIQANRDDAVAQFGDQFFTDCFTAAEERMNEVGQ